MLAVILRILSTIYLHFMVKALTIKPFLVIHTYILSYAAWLMKLLKLLNIDIQHKDFRRRLYTLIAFIELYNLIVCILQQQLFCLKEGCLKKLTVLILFEHQSIKCFIKIGWQRTHILSVIFMFHIL